MKYQARILFVVASVVLGSMLYAAYNFTMDAKTPALHKTKQHEKKNPLGTDGILKIIRDSKKQNMTLRTMLAIVTTMEQHTTSTTSTTSTRATTTKPNTPTNTTKATTLASTTVDPIRKFPTPHFVPKRYRGDKKALLGYVKYLNETEEPLPKQDTAVIILTNYRSGSTFFGELFNQHPDIFFIYEPVWLLSSLDSCDSPELKMQVLKGLVQCELPDWRKIYQDLPREKQIERSNWMVASCLNQDMCFRWKTSGLCDKRHCPTSNHFRVRNCITECGSVNMQLVNNECRRRKMAAMKVIRMCDILHFKDMFTTVPTNVKIVHLIRDPRAIASSSLQINKKANVKGLLSGICGRQYHNLKSAMQDTPEWLKEKYMVVRYEDVASSPYEKIESIYNFIGLDFPDVVKKWIQKNTKISIPTKPSTTSTNNTRNKQTTVLTKPIPRRVNPWGTSRDSREVVQKWVRNLPYDTAKIVEGLCSNIMKLAGYKPVETREQYNNKTGVKYFVDEDVFLKNIEQFT